MKTADYTQLLIGSFKFVQFFNIVKLTLPIAYVSTFAALKRKTTKTTEHYGKDIPKGDAEVS